MTGSLKQAIRHERIDRNVALGAEPPAVHSKHTRPPDRNELFDIIDAANIDPQFLAFLCTAASTGARVGELAALRWRDLDLDAQRLNIDKGIGGDNKEGDTKTYKHRVIALDAVTCEALAAHRDRAERLAADCGSPLDGARYLFSPRPDSDTDYNLRRSGVATSGCSRGSASPTRACTASGISAVRN